MNASDNTPESETGLKACYQLDRSILITGIVCTALFLVCGLFSVGTALFFGLFWSCWVLLCLFIIFAYYRLRLFIAKDAITYHGCIGKKNINVSDVTQILWRRFPSQCGRIIVRSRLTRITIHLDNYTDNDQEQLVAYFRDTFSPDIQKNWSRYDEFRQRHLAALKKIPAKIRGVGIIIALLLFASAGAAGYCWSLDLGGFWLAIGVALALAGLVYVWRVFHFRKQTLTDRLG